MNTSNAPFKVVCVEDNWYGMVDVPENAPKKDKVYTVVNEGMCTCGFCGMPVYYLAECGVDVGWAQDWFVPVQNKYEDNRQSIAQSFTETIETHDQKERIKPDRILNQS